MITRGKKSLFGNCRQRLINVIVEMLGQPNFLMP